MTVRFAFQGFRHNHIFDLYHRAAQHPRITIVGACEQDAAAREQVESERGIRITHQDPSEMLEEVACDVVAIGDYYGRRGGLAIEALRRGKHVISDKPLCTSLQEFGEISALATTSGLSVCCMLDLRDWGHFLALRRAVRRGLIGDVTAASFGGQHELKYGQRATWYFEEGKHGGTLNDLAVHGLDLIRWITGLRFSQVNAARAWNARLPQAPHFQDGAQLMAELENGAGVLGDVSYFLPEGQTASIPHHWRTTIWGSKGLAETSFADRTARIWLAGEDAARVLDPVPDQPGNYLEAFLREIDGQTHPGDLTTAESLEAARVALATQEAADQARHSVDLLEPSSEREEWIAAG